MLFAICLVGFITEDASSIHKFPKPKQRRIANFSWLEVFEDMRFRMGWALATASIAMLLFWQIVELAILQDVADYTAFFEKVALLSIGSILCWFAVLVLDGMKRALTTLKLSIMIACIYAIIAIPAAKLAGAKGGVDLDVFKKIVINYSVANNIGRIPFVNIPGIFVQTLVIDFVFSGFDTSDELPVLLGD